MGLYSGELTIGRNLASEIWGAYFREGLFFLDGGEGGLLSEFYGMCLLSAGVLTSAVNRLTYVCGLQEKLRHLLRVSGVSTFVYWLQFFLFDALLFLIPCVLLLILIPAFQLPSLSPPPAMGALVLCLLLYLPAGILFSYTCSFMFNKWDTAQQVMPQLFMYVSTTARVFCVCHTTVSPQFTCRPCDMDSVAF